ncbi:hypothetical protein [Hymenobacter sp. B1770]|uniref:hypothetical protein n=1 Tax=Hymenobacter sp. B1770 TaxID=1718788 RepID=UPI003CF3FA9C
MSTGDRNALNLLGEQAKDNTPNATNRVRLAALRGYLRGLPSLNFSEKGRANICARFMLSEAELGAAIATLEARPSRPAAALLRTIGAAVAASHRANATGGADPC